MAPPLKKQLGDRGEALVAEWLQRSGWQLIAQQWSCRWGELDIVAHRPTGLAFVEVKTRRYGSLDGAGRCAVTPQKQKKLWRSAALFLARYPHYGDVPCRFDVALVAHNPPAGQPVIVSTLDPLHGSLALLEYITDAFQL